MPKLEKFDIPGHVHFVTSKVDHFIPLFLAHDLCRILLANIDFYRVKHNFKLLGYVIMPDHIHVLICPQADIAISKIMQDIKRYSAKQIFTCLAEQPTNWDELGGLVISFDKLKLASKTPARHCLQNLHVPKLDDFRVIKPRTSGQEHQLWQESFYDFNIYTEAKLKEKLDYIHSNPLKWKLVEDAFEYPYSSFRNYYDHVNFDLPIEVDLL